MESMDLCLGVDGGQSATKAAVGDLEGRILARGQGGPCNHANKGEGREKLERGLREAVGGALSQLGLELPSTRFRGACLGMSGGPDDKREIIAELIGADALEVTTDAHAALFGAAEGGAGVIVISGTGSIAMGRDGAGAIHRAGGWGYIFGDEGSAFDISRQALRAALRAEEGWGPETDLQRRLLQATGAASANELLHRCYTDELPRDRVATWATWVDEAAVAGDAEARRILQTAGRQLAEIALSVWLRVHAADAPVAYAGGGFRSAALLKAFRERIRAATGGEPCRPAAPPEAGALRRAREIARPPIKETA